MSRELERTSAVTDIPQIIVRENRQLFSGKE
jgi:hypothetical protein